ncbi:MAG: hypothetical protein EXR79_00110 [Myxococcales bacterium]|nr:hypothetical protein [Myxococcales bacterium]
MSEVCRGGRSLGIGVALLVLVASACSEPAPTTSAKSLLPETSFGAGDSAIAEDNSAVAPDVPDKPAVPCEIEGGWGCPCENNDACTSGYCVESELGKVCTKVCQSKCPKDWKCVQAAGTGDLTYVCVSLFTNLCRPCKLHDDCKQTGAAKDSSLCVPRVVTHDNPELLEANGSFCGTGCTEDTDCRAGFQCVEVSAPVPGAEEPIVAKQCVPVDGAECGCTPEWSALKFSTPCTKSNVFGTCTGTRTCGENGLTLCNKSFPETEQCDNEDNDCDGKTDESEKDDKTGKPRAAIGCVAYWPDNDGDGTGIGEGECLCANPGVGYAKIGGDCNDLVASVKPGADEICNNLDDNCNGDTDESGSKGCKVFYKDKDGDKFGDIDDSACLCPSKKTADWIEQGGDCDDGNGKVNPTTKESCNAKDDNCNGKTDEEGADGCKPHYLDVDKDGFGPNESLKCLCGPTKIHTTAKGGDCDDNDPKIKPNVTELCNGLDDDCNGKTDEDPAGKSCPDVAGGKGGCLVGKCGIGTCAKGLFDVDANVTNGCECSADNNYGVVGAKCEAGIALGQLGDGGNSVFKSGNVMPGEAGDWYQFLATDSPDDGGACDQFDVRVKFSDNPGEQFAFDLFRGSCAGADQLCKEQTSAEWNVSFSGAAPSGPQAKTGQPAGAVVKSPNPEVGGECKCTKAPGLPGMNICVDNSAKFFVFVFRKPGFKPTCESYTLSFINAPPK